MTTTTMDTSRDTRTAAATHDAAQSLIRVGNVMMRYSLVLILMWIGAFKFTAYEAQGIKPLVENSPLMAWAYHALGLRSLAGVIGAVEITVGALLAVRPLTPRLSVLGSVGAIAIFLTTLSFLFSTPGVWQPDYGFPFLSSKPGQFLAKDVVLLAVAVWSCGDALRAVRIARDRSDRVSSLRPPAVVR